MKDIGLYCVSESDKPPACYRYESDLCPVLGLDERYGEFIGTHSWPTSYTILNDDISNNMVEVYNRPVLMLH